MNRILNITSAVDVRCTGLLQCEDHRVQKPSTALTTDDHLLGRQRAAAASRNPDVRGARRNGQMVMFSVVLPTVMKSRCT